MKRFAPIALACALLVACGNAEHAALAMYLAEGQDMSTELSEVGTKLETLMNLQGNIAAWTDAEKQELQTVSDALSGLITKAKEMSAPETLSEVHPLLVQSLEELAKGVEGISTVAKDPASMTESIATEMESHMTKADDLSTEYLQKLETVIKEHAPDLLQE